MYYQLNGFLSSVHKVARIKDIEVFGYAQNDLTGYNFALIVFIIQLREVEMKINGSIKNGTDKIASECYRMMKNMYKKEYSEISNMFYGIHVSRLNLWKAIGWLLRLNHFSILCCQFHKIKL